MDDSSLLRLSQISSLTGLKRHAINARAKTFFDKNTLIRSAGNQILLDPLQVRKLISDRMYDFKGKIIYIGNLKSLARNCIFIIFSCKF